jgi:hypothetical protein
MLGNATNSTTAPSATQPTDGQEGSNLIQLTLAENATLTLLTLLVAVVAVVSNSLLLYVVVRTPALHTATNFFIASLSAGELLTGLFVIPFSGSSATLDESWAFSTALCRFVGFVGVLGPCVSALSLLVVSTDRYVAITKPLR